MIQMSLWPQKFLIVSAITGDSNSRGLINGL